MSNVTISELPTAQTITGTELVPVQQNGLTVQTTVSAITNSPVQTQTFITVNTESTLPNSRYLGTGSGLTTTDGGIQGKLSVNLTGAPLSLVTSGTGIQVKTSSTALSARLLAFSGTGLTITNPDGISGNPTFAFSGVMANLSTFSGTGLLGINGTTIQNLTITGTTNQTAITNGNGASGNPVIGLANNPVIPGTASLTIPVGATAARPVATASGMIRYNSDLQQFEGYNNIGWSQFSLSGGVTSFSGGSTGFSPSLATTGAVTLGGTLLPASGGTGANTLTGYVYGNGTSVMTAATTIPTTALSGTVSNAQLANSAITINGNSVSLGGSTTVTASTTSTLTIGTGLSGTSFNGSSPVTIAIDSTVATLTGSQVLTNKSISGATNTLSSIANASLTNSAITINGTSTSLGGSISVGTVTSVTSSTLTVAGTSAVPTINLTSGIVTAGTTGSATLIPVVTVDTYGRVTSITTAANPQGTVTSVSGTGTVNGITLTGTVTSSGSLTLGGTLGSIANSQLTNSTISGVALGSNLNALTIGTGLSGTSYNGSSAVTVAIDSTVATLTGAQVLTNKSISGSTNTLTNIANASLTNSSLTVGTTAISLGATSLTLGGLTSVALTQDPVSALQVTTKQYVDAAVSNINYHAACSYATTVDLGTVTYSNGSSGVGATITNAGTQAALVIDGHTFTSTDVTNAVRILIKNESNGAYNGIYTLTNQGSITTNWVVTRATDYDQVGSGVNEVAPGDTTFILSGTVNTNTQWVQTTPLPITLGTTAISFVQIGGPGSYTAGTGLTLTGSQFSLTSPVTTALGGTGVTTAPTAGAIVYGVTTSTLGYTAAGTSGQVLASAGAGTPTWTSTASINITGTAPAGTLTGTTLNSTVVTSSLTSVGTIGTGVWNGTAVTVPYGGTGVATLTGLAYGNATSAFTAATAAQVVAVIGATAVTNATNAVNTGITAATTGATNYLTFVTATSGNLPQLVNSSITANAVNGTITGGVSGGAF